MPTDLFMIPERAYTGTERSQADALASILKVSQFCVNLQPIVLKTPQNV